MKRSFEIQGHRGARARRPENTLPSFEAALDACVASIETDLQLTRDGDVAIYHDGRLSKSICALFRNGSKNDLPREPRIAELRSSTLSRIIADRNPDSRRFPEQRAESTPLSDSFARAHFRLPHDPYAIPLLRHLFAFVKAYANDPEKNRRQRESARHVVLDLEIKNEPFAAPVSATLLGRIADFIREAGMEGRCRVRSFDHRLVKAFKRIVPAMNVGILVSGTAAVDPARLVRDADAAYFCPDYRMLDEEQIKRLDSEGIRVLPWTVNDEVDWRRLIEWGVDGITTDDPRRLGEFIKSQ